jgi:1,4-dihydroxy-2-naphthoate octaprenyltransferase
LPYVLGVTTVIFGKHIDKMEADKSKKIHTLPVLLGEKNSRFLVLLMMVVSYVIVLVLILTRFFTPIMLIVFLAVPNLVKIIPAFRQPRPKSKPADFPEGNGGWPLYFAPLAFINNRSFGGYFMIGLLADVLLRIFLPSFWV